MEVDAFESNGLLGFGGSEELMLGVEELQSKRIDERMQVNDDEQKGKDHEGLEAKGTPLRSAGFVDTDDPFTSNGLLLNPTPTQSSRSIPNEIPISDHGITSPTTIHHQRPPRCTTRPRQPIIETPLPAWRPPIEGRTSTGKIIQFPRRRKPISGGENVSMLGVCSLDT